MTDSIYKRILQEHSLDELAVASDNKTADKTHLKSDELSQLLSENTLVQLYRGPEYKFWVVAKTGKPVDVECLGTEPIDVYRHSKEEGDLVIAEEVKTRAVKYQANAYALSLNELNVHGDRVLSVVFLKIKPLQEAVTFD